MVPKAGDWVIGPTAKEAIYVKGYVTKVDTIFNQVLVKVVEVDRSEDPFIKVGSQVLLHMKQAKILPDIEVEQEEPYLRNMIDIALSIGDRDWFMELTAKLNKKKSVPLKTG